MRESRVEGLEETLSMLDGLPKALVLGGYNKAFHAAAGVIERELDARVPIRLEYEGKDLMVAGGALKGALMFIVTLDSNYRGGIVAVGFGKLGYIANFVEYGHRMVTHKPGLKEVGFVPAYPFMRPAADAAHEPSVDAFARSLAGTVRELNHKA
ncbi:MAG: hypothetical protein LAQ69_22435 [Acidobacteriia bacterium]|nr:hypothetical protein [Terriglobia bacterium]